MRPIKKMLRTFVVNAFLAGSMLLPTLAVSAQVTYDTRYLTGDPAPGQFGDPVFIAFYNNPVINSQGQIAFHAQVEGLGIGTGMDTGIWSEGSGSLNMVMREGSRTISMPSNVVFDSFAELVLNDAGRVAFLGNLSSGSSTDDGVWSQSAGSLDMIAREGDAAPQTTPFVTHNALFFTDPRLNAAGQTAFLGNLTGPGVAAGNETAIWLHSAGTLNLAVRGGMAAPGLGAGVLYSYLNNPALNASGQIAFESSLTGAGVDTTNDSGIWSGGPGSLSLVAREGDPAPGLPPEFTLAGFDTVPAINDAGQTAFVGYLDGPGMTLLNNFGIWSGGPGSISLVTRSGTDAPDTEAGISFSSLAAPVINGAGQAAFSANLRGTGIHQFNGEGIWSEASGSLRLVARDGQHAPGTEPGVLLNNLDNFSNGLLLNNAGQVVFRSWLVGSGVVEDVNDFGIWAAEPDGELSLIVRTGDLFDVNDDPLIQDLRTISTIDEFVTGSGGEDGQGTSFNDAGQLIFGLGFTDGSEGLFVANLLLEGDLNGDGFVGVDDLNILLINWNATVTPGDLSAGDLTGEGFVGVDDLNILLVNWNAGTPPPGQASIPEPGTGALLGLAALVLARRRR